MIRIAVQELGKLIESRDYENDRVRIGSAGDNDLRLDSAAVSPHHAEVWQLDGQCRVRSPDGVRLYLSGEELGSRAAISDQRR